MLYFRTFLFAIALLVFNLGQAQAFSLPDNFHTQSTPLVLEPLPDADIKVAGVYWLPDYLEKNLDFNNQTQGGGEKPVVNPSCNNLGYTVPTFVTDWSKYNYTKFLAANAVYCYKNFLCKASFSKPSCAQWYQLAGGSCKDARGTFYERCDPKPCAATYTAGVTSCSPAAGYTYASSGYSGAQVCGKCTAKACANGYSTAVKSCGSGYTFATNGMSGSSNCGICNQRACSEGGYYDSNPNTNTYKCSAVTWGGKTCQRCYQPQCSEGGYQTSSTKAGYICKAASYYGRSCYGCSTPDPCYGLTDNYPCSYGCETTYSQCTGKCSKCYADNCRNRSAVIANCPSNATCSKFADCSSKISSWSCNSGYHKEGNSCAIDCTPKAAATGCAYGTESCSNGCGGTTTCCKACSLPNCTSITAKPANSTYTTKSCTDCNGTKTINSGWTCDSGYTQSGSSCLDKCQIKGKYSYMTKIADYCIKHTYQGGLVCYDCDECWTGGFYYKASITYLSSTKFCQYSPQVMCEYIRMSGGSGAKSMMFTTVTRNITAESKEECQTKADAIITAEAYFGNDPCAKYKNCP